jgi:hypothetical protein
MRPTNSASASAYTRSDSQQAGTGQSGARNLILIVALTTKPSPDIFTAMKRLNRAWATYSQFIDSLPLGIQVGIMLAMSIASLVGIMSLL